ncbi:lysophospholipid acyltransferase family protein [Streptomyces apocyni]|uniref:lysophospholipid acyltransferase family protein n=1 Tax=Streptomyces apocyni TaxID=2654677 RepID=UPI001E2F0015|nr:lysophospholipid acyltransferase family protein [Streptomyces apocyni]
MVSTTAPVRRTTRLRRYADVAALLGGALAAGRTLGDPTVVRRRARGLLDALGVRLELDGDESRTAPGTLIVADHVSWLDPIALLAHEPAILLAKSEVARWPVAGRLTTRVGTCFIDRARPRALPEAVAGVRDHLLAGRSVMVFPQATTWCRESGGVFRRAMFQAALDAGAPVRPVTISYRQHGVPSTVAAFVGDDGFLPSLLRVAGADGLTVRITAHDPLLPGGGADRRTLAAHAQRAVASGGWGLSGGFASATPPPAVRSGST